MPARDTMYGGVTRCMEMSHDAWRCHMMPRDDVRRYHMMQWGATVQLEQPFGGGCVRDCEEVVGCVTVEAW